DEFGRRNRAHDELEGIESLHARVVAGVPNQVALIFVGERGQNLIGVAPGASAHFTPDDIERLPASVFSQGGVLLACLEIPLETVIAGVQRAKLGGMTVVLNPAPAVAAAMESEIVQAVDVWTPNEEEAAVLVGQGGAASGGSARLAARIL